MKKVKRSLIALVVMLALAPLLATIIQRVQAQGPATAYPVVGGYHTVTAGECTNNLILLNTGLPWCRGTMVQWYNADKIYSHGLAVIENFGTGGVVKITNSLSTQITSNDVLRWVTTQRP